MISNYTEYDYRCEVCGRGYFADVGWGMCSHCTPEQKQEYARMQEKIHEEEIKKRRAYFRSQEYLDMLDEEAQFSEDDDRPY